MVPRCLWSCHCIQTNALCLLSYLAYIPTQIPYQYPSKTVTVIVLLGIQCNSPEQWWQQKLLKNMGAQ